MTDQTVIDIRKLAALDTCTVSNTIEFFNVRMRNEGFLCGSVECRFPKFAPMVGYAATARVRTAAPPMSQGCYYDRMDWWQYVASVPEPRVMVLQDADPGPGLGAFVGEIHAAIGRALNCVGCVTNGSVRDLEQVEAMGFQLFSGSVSVSHSYAHIIDFGEPVQLDGLKVASGDLLHGDRQGVLMIPMEIAAEIPQKAREILKQEAELVAFCRSPQFSLGELAKRLKSANGRCDLPWRRS